MEEGQAFSDNFDWMNRLEEIYIILFGSGQSCESESWTGLSNGQHRCRVQVIFGCTDIATGNKLIGEVMHSNHTHVTFFRLQHSLGSRAIPLWACGTLRCFLYALQTGEDEISLEKTFLWWTGAVLLRTCFHLLMDVHVCESKISKSSCFSKSGKGWNTESHLGFALKNVCWSWSCLSLLKTKRLFWHQSRNTTKKKL